MWGQSDTDVKILRAMITEGRGEKPELTRKESK